MNKAILWLYVHDLNKPRQIYMELTYNYISMYTPRGATTDSFCNDTQPSHRACTSITKHSEYLPGQKNKIYKGKFLLSHLGKTL